MRGPATGRERGQGKLAASYPVRIGSVGSPRRGPSAGDRVHELQLGDGLERAGGFQELEGVVGGPTLLADEEMDRILQRFTSYGQR